MLSIAGNYHYDMGCLLISKVHPRPIGPTRGRQTHSLLDGIHVGFRALLLHFGRGAAFIFSKSKQGPRPQVLGGEVLSAGGGILIASILGGEVLDFSAAAALPGAQVGHALASLSLKQIPALCPNGHPAYFSDWVQVPGCANIEALHSLSG
jgi:hypothetical protein